LGISWPKTKLTSLLGIDLPIIQAGMAGGSTTPELVAAVSNAGGLGTLGAGYMSPKAIREAIQRIRELTSRPFAVNLFIPGATQASDEQVQAVNRRLDRYRRELGIPTGITPELQTETFPDQLAVVLEERVHVFSFTFGIPEATLMNQLKSAGIRVIGTATTVREAVLLEQAGVDAVVAQGSEAGGHRGTFAGSFDASQIGTMALVPQVVDHVSIPVIASGGIMDGRGIIATLFLGAAGVQMGTAFVTCSESGAHELHKLAILRASEEDTRLTRAFSGKPARGIVNRFMREMAPYDKDIPDYPAQNALTRDIRQAASQQHRPEFLSMWAGQGVRLATTQSAGTLIQRWVQQVESLR
jgi:nitronate monooxygenase